MPAYLVHGFRWPRDGFTGIRVHAIVNNLEDCSVEYIQNANSKEDLLRSFQAASPELMRHLRTLDFIEQYDPGDTSPQAVSQPYAYVTDKIITLAAIGTAAATLSVNAEEVISNGSGTEPQASEALEGLRDKIAPGEKIAWWAVYNGDPERAYDSDDEFEEGSTPVQATPTEEDRPVVPPKSPTTPSAMAIRSKAVPDLPSPTKEVIPEPPKLKEVAKASGFRKKFFGKKA